MFNKYTKKTKSEILLNYKIPHYILIVIVILLAAIQANSAEKSIKNSLNSPTHTVIYGLPDSVFFKASQ